VKLTTHLSLGPRSKNAWSYSSTPNTSSWRGVRLKHRVQKLLLTLAAPTLSKDMQHLNIYIYIYSEVKEWVELCLHPPKRNFTITLYIYMHSVSRVCVGVRVPWFVCNSCVS
jgi:hypothetical protein